MQHASKKSKMSIDNEGEIEECKKKRNFTDKFIVTQIVLRSHERSNFI